MDLKGALKQIEDTNNTLDILEILGISKYSNHDTPYYQEKIQELAVGDYFISDLDGTFFRGVLQKEVVTLFVKFITSQKYYEIDVESYYEFLKDLQYFREIEKEAHNKKIRYSHYLHAGIYLLLRHKDLVSWEEFLVYVQYHFTSKQKIKPYKFSFQKLRETLMSGNNFIFVSGAPDFIFEIYLSLLKKYVTEHIGVHFADNIYGFGSHFSIKDKFFAPLWGAEHKKSFISSLQQQGIIQNSIGGMGDTASDFGISQTLRDGVDFYFVNPERKVVEHFEELKTPGVNYHLIVERKDLIFRFDNQNVEIIDV